ncbi:MAG: hypothetical protein IJ774_14405 [Selenomonadaceae bacterium]|nr:hypothetical protein [Selenomonadaceae bacterium]
MFQQLKARRGFVFVELAIALPLLILLMYTLANVTAKIAKQGRNQLADYVLEEEAHQLLERIVRQARAAKEVEPRNGSNGVKFVYHATIDENRDTENPPALTVEDVLETQYYLAYQKSDSQAINLYAEHQDKVFVNPITGDNTFGETSLVKLEFRERETNVLHITLEMESLVTDRIIKLSTAVYMPACELKPGLIHDD